jgi:hypothetical protein
MPKAILLAILVLSATACVPSFEVTERAWLKWIKIPGGEIAWFTYTAAYADSPDFIVLEAGNKADTLCITDNVVDMYLEHRSLHIHFNGRPSLYTKGISIPSKLGNYKVILDTASAPFSSAGRQYLRR